MSEFHTLTDSEGVELQSNVPFRFACCDCGLVHDMVIVSEDGKPVGFAIKRMPEATAERRASLGADFDHWLYHEQTEHDVDGLNKSAIELARAAYQRAGRADNTDYIGLALELESAAKRVESQTVQRAMEAGAHGLRLAHSFRAALSAQPGAQPLGCGCAACRPHSVEMRMILCEVCGDKRCPHAADHRNECSNQPKQHNDGGAG